MINLTEESGPSHDIRTTENEPPPPRLVVVVVAAYLNLSNWDELPVKNVVEGTLVFDLEN